jgi:hypothetical protein
VGFGYILELERTPGGETPYHHTWDANWPILAEMSNSFFNEFFMGVQICLLYSVVWFINDIVPYSAVFF